MDKKKIIGFPKNHPILFNLLLIVVAFLVLVNIVLFAIDGFTGHGEYVVVPELKGKTLNAAELEIRENGFKCEIADSTYNNSYEPGAVVDQEPKSNSKVKANRTIYLTINAVMPRKVAFPKVLDMSSRQGRAVLEGLGFKNIRIDTVASPYKELIVGVSADGKEVIPGERLPLTVPVVLSIGSGGMEVVADSLATDSLMMETIF